MADEQQFIEDGLQRTQIDEFFADELGRAGYGGMEVAKTPMGTQIVLKAEKPGMVIGKGGKNIRKITDTLETEFELDDPQVDVQEVEEPDLNARIVADRLANALERGWYFRKAGHTTIDRIMDAGALGAEIVLSGKVTGARSRVEKFNRGYIKHNGEPAEEIVDEGIGTAVMKLGTIGVQVRIIPPGADLPDDFQIYEDADVSDYVEESEGVEELLEEEEPDEGPAETAEPTTGAPPEEAEEETSEVEEEIVEEAAEAQEAEDEDEETDAAGEEPDVEEELDEETAAEAEELIDEMEDAEASDEDEEADAESDAETASDEAEDDADEDGEPQAAEAAEGDAE